MNSELKNAWNELMSANSLYESAVEDSDFGIMNSRKSLADKAYRNFWAIEGAEEFAENAPLQWVE